MAQIRFRTVSPLAFFLILFTSPSSLKAQQTAEPWVAPHFSIDPKALYQAASAVAASPAEVPEVEGAAAGAA